MKLPLLGAIGLLAPLLLTAAAPEALRIRVVQSGGSVHVAGTRTSTVLTVEVVDQSNQPVEGAAVSFRLPSSGAGGVFSNGISTDVVITGSSGRAAVSGVRWNQAPGTFEMGVTAAQGQARATLAVSHRVLAPAGEAGPATAKLAGSRSRLKLTLILAGVAAGSVAAGLAVSRKTPTNPAQATTQTLSVGMPTTITIGGPN